MEHGIPPETGPGTHPGVLPMVLRNDADGVATLTLNNPASRNALSSVMMASLMEALAAADHDKTVKVVVLAADGPAYCAGHDLKEVRANAGQAFYDRLFRQCSELMITVTRLSKPVIARVHGMATAAGCQLVASCDLAVAGRSARFATPGVNIGLFCSTPMVALSRAIGRKPAMKMLLTGDPVDAETAERLGLVNDVVDDGDLPLETHKLARKIAEKSPLTLKIGKEAFYRQVEMGLDDAYSYTSAVMVENMMASDAAEGIDAFLEKRRPEWSGT